jgi:hypothetical protein
MNEECDTYMRRGAIAGLQHCQMRELVKDTEGAHCGVGDRLRHRLAQGVALKIEGKF